MAKIVVLAGPEDSEAVKTALEGASLDFDIIDPTPSNLLHIVIGMVDNTEEEPSEEVESEEPSEDEVEPEEQAEPTEELPEEPTVEESIGDVSIDGEKFKAYKSKDSFSTFFAKSLSLGPKITYAIDESTAYSFWPENAKVPRERLSVKINKKLATTVSVALAESKKDKPYFTIGSDLIHLFK